MGFIQTERPDRVQRRHAYPRNTLHWDARFAVPAQRQNLPMKHRPWDFQAGCDHLEYPESCVITLYLGN